jgi:pyrimidine deaminase RibD-like protein
MKLADFRIHDTEKLDGILADLCELVVRGQQNNPNKFGVVAAAVLDPNNELVSALNYKRGDKNVHAERAAIDLYRSTIGEIPAGSIIITTCSPCSEDHDETAQGRYGESCTDVINNSKVRKVYCGYEDPSQNHRDDKKFHVMASRNPKIHELCHMFASTWLNTEQLDELSFLGSPCTKDCSGHRAGYNWSKQRGNIHAASWSPSFNNGAALAVAGK